MARLVVGLGNPGKDYEKSKHNVGFICVDQYANSKKMTFRKEAKFQGEVAIIGSNLLLKPKTYMNLSGNSVKALADYYKIKPSDILVISDDLDLPFGKIRLRESGGTGGHNGLKSIVSSLGSNEFNRCRIGIGRNDSLSVVDQVLSNFSKIEYKELMDISILLIEMIDSFFDGVEYPIIMNKFNTTK